MRKNCKETMNQEQAPWIRRTTRINNDTMVVRTIWMMNKNVNDLRKKNKTRMDDDEEEW